MIKDAIVDDLNQRKKKKTQNALNSDWWTTLAAYQKALMDSHWLLETAIVYFRCININYCFKTNFVWESTKSIQSYSI